jgi:hypothetical protein
MSLMGVSSLMAGNRSLTGAFLGTSIGTDRARNMIQCLIEKAARGKFKVAIEPARYPRPLRPHPYIESRLAVGKFS